MFVPQEIIQAECNAHMWSIGAALDGDLQSVNEVLRLSKALRAQLIPQAFERGMPRRAFRKLLRFTWTDDWGSRAIFETVGYDYDLVRTWFRYAQFRPIKKKRITVWRGVSCGRGEAIPVVTAGLAWSSDRARGAWFATQYGGYDRSPPTFPLLIEATVPTVDVIAHFKDRGEDEYIVDATKHCPTVEGADLEAISRPGWAPSDEVAQRWNKLAQAATA